MIYDNSMAWEGEQLSFHSKILIARPNIAVNMAYESPIIGFSKKSSLPQILYKLTVRQVETWRQVCPGSKFHVFQLT